MQRQAMAIGPATPIWRITDGMMPTHRLYFACYLQAPAARGRHGRLQRKTLRCRGSRTRETNAMTRQPFAAFALAAVIAE